MKNLSRIAAQCAIIATLGTAFAAHATTVASFDDLLAPPATDAATGLQFTNNSNSLQYQGVLWDSRFTVVGDAYKVNPNPPPPNPLFGVPHSGHYYVSNGDGGDGLLLGTTQLLTGAWFGRNQYYGFSEGGADQVRIVALAGASDLLTLVFDLPDSHPGEPEPLSFFDTGAFAALTGITGYRIDRREIGTQAGHWVADDFQFEPASLQPVSEPGVLPLVGLALLAACRVRRRN